VVNAKGLVVKKQTTKLKLLLFVFVSNLSNRLKRWLRIMFRSVLKVTHNSWLYAIGHYNRLSFK